MMAQSPPEERRSFLTLGGGLLLAGFGGGSEVGARSFEEFMAEKRQQEAAEERKKAGLPAFVEPEPSAVEEDDDGTPKEPAPSAFDDYKDVVPVVDDDPLRTLLVTVLRVQESTLQQERLIRTGQFRDLQRNNIKKAAQMIVDNTRIRDVVNKASASAAPDKIQEAATVGKDAIGDLLTLIEYFDQQTTDNLKVTDLSKDKKEFISKALTSSRQKFDKFLTYMPVEKVAAARAKVMEENELNQKEMPKDIQILNPVFMN